MLPNGTTASVDETYFPRLFSIAPGERVFGVPWPHIEDELSLTCKLLLISKKWAITVLTNNAVSLNQRLATEETAVSYDELVAAERAKAEASAGNQAEAQQTGPWPW